MSYTASKLLEIAAAEIGYKEKETNSQLDNPTANAGDNNWTKYARDLHTAGYYQAPKNGYAWCDMFVDWCFLHLGGSKEKGEWLECQTGLYGAGCEWSSNCYRWAGRFDKNPKPGDQIFFGKTGAEEHTGIVEKVENGKVYTIEGNASNQVKRCTYSLTSSRIVGYGHPRFDAETEEPEAPAVQPTTPATPSATIKAGDVVKVRDGATYYTGTKMPAWVQAKDWIVREVSGDRAVINKSSDGKYAINSPVNVKDLILVTAEESKPVAPSAPAQTLPGTPSTSADEKAIWDALMDKIGNAYGVAGVMGNLYAESALRSNNLQQSYEKKLGYTDETYTAAVDNGTYTNFVKDSAGYGLAQWTYWSLKEDMLTYFQSKKVSIGDWKTQIEFLVKQLSEDYKSVMNTLKNAGSILDASNAMLLKFERPADQSEAVQAKRCAYGQNYYDKYAQKPVKPVEPTAPAQPVTKSIKKGDVVSIAKGAKYYTGANIPSWVIAKQWVVKSVSGARVVIDKSTDGKNAICSPVDAKYLTVVTSADEVWVPKVGDRVMYNGTVHYSHANATSGPKCKGGLAKITNIYQLGKSKHPYHLVREAGKGATVWGWCDEGSFTKA